MAVNVWQGVQQGQQLVDNLFRQRDQMRAGRALATGDYGSAMRALGAGGDVQGVRQIQADQVQAQQRQRATQEEDTARQVAFTRQATAALRRAVTEGGDALATYDSMAPAFQQIGATPEQLQQYRQALAADPEGFLTNIERATAEAERKLSFQKAGDRLLVFEDGSPDPVRQFDAPARPKYITVEGADGRPQIVEVGSGAPGVVFEGEAPREEGPEVTTLSPQEVAAMGLQPGVYQRKRDGAITPVSGQGGDRLSAGQQRQVESYYQEIAGLDNIDAELGRFDSMIASGDLELSPVANTVGGVRNAIGLSSENSRNLAEFRSTLERVRNDSLRLNNGVQTEGDAKRAWDELVSNINDPAVVRQQLRRIMSINQRARQFRQQRIDALEGGGQRPDAQTGGGQTRTRPQNRPPVQFNTTEAQNSRWASTPRTGRLGTRDNPSIINPGDVARSFNNVPRGGFFITPDGELRGPKP